MLLLLIREQKEIVRLKMLFRPEIQNLLLFIEFGSILPMGRLTAVTYILIKINALMFPSIGSTAILFAICFYTNFLCVYNFSFI